MTAPLRVVGAGTPLGTLLLQFIMGQVKENLTDATSSALKMQEIPFDHPDSRCMFDSQFVATTGALRMHGADAIARRLQELQKLAEERKGLDYLQVFRLPSGRLWIIDSDQYVTALLPDEY